jgi:hypothetical protein
MCLVTVWATNVLAQTDRIKVIVNGKEIQAKGILSPPKGPPMVPLEAVCKDLGIDYSFDKIGNALVAIKGESTLYAPIGKKEAIVSGEGVTLDEAPKVEGGIAYIQANILQKAFNLDVNWKEAEKTIEISSEAAPPPPSPAATGPVRLLKDIMAEKPGQKKTRLLIDGKELDGELALEGDRLLAPVKQFASALGCTVAVGTVEAKTVFAIKTSAGTTIDLAIDSDTAHVSNLPAEAAGTSEPKEVKLLTPCRTVAGEIYVPVTSTVELAGASWIWKPEDKVVEVSTGKQPPPPPSPAGGARLMSAIVAEKPNLKPIRLTVNGVELQGELAMESGRLLAPAAALAQELGWTAAVDGTKVTLTGPAEAKLSLEVGSMQGELTGGDKVPHPFQLIGSPRLLGANILYLPVAGLVEAMGATRAWDDGIKTAQIFTAGVAPPEGVKPAKDAAGQAKMVLEMGVEKPPRMSVEGKELKAALAMENGRLLAPLHVLAHALGWEWQWQTAAEAPKGAMGVRSGSGEKWLHFAIGSAVAKDGQERKLASSVRFLRGMLFVSVADFAEVTGASWRWDKANKIVDIKRPAAPESAVKVGEILSDPAAHNGQLVFVVGRYAGKEPTNSIPALAGGPPTSPQDWLLENGTGTIYVAYDPAADLSPAMEKGQEVALWAMVRLTKDSRPYLEPGLAGGKWELVPNAQGG